MNLFLHVIGARGTTGAALWGGIIGDSSIFVGLILYVRHKNCHHKGCWRGGKHQVAINGITTPYCHHHVDSDSHPGIRKEV